MLRAVLAFLAVLTVTGLAVALALPRLTVFYGLLAILTWVLAMLFALLLLSLRRWGYESEPQLLEAPTPQNFPFLTR